jgi:hypothetical protein
MRGLSLSIFSSRSESMGRLSFVWYLLHRLRKACRLAREKQGVRNGSSDVDDAMYNQKLTSGKIP